MENEYIINLENKVQGCLTRMDELHWSAPSHAMHIITDEFKHELGEFSDDLMENLQALFGFIRPGDLSAEAPKATEFEELLVEIRSMLADFKDKFTEKAYSGANNIIDDFWQTVNRYVYLAKITKGDAKE